MIIDLQIDLQIPIYKSENHQAKDRHCFQFSQQSVNLPRPLWIGMQTRYVQLFPLASDTTQNFGSPMQL